MFVLLISEQPDKSHNWFLKEDIFWIWVVNSCCCSCSAQKV